MFQFLRNRFKRKPRPGRLMVLNPTSRNGKALGQFEMIESRLREMLGRFEVYFTKSSGDATERIRMALKDREFSQILVAGGDGTIHEAMNAYFEKGQSICKDIPLGVINLGTGGDFYKTIRKMSPDYSVALRNNAFRLVDCGEAVLQPMGFTRYFMNIASAGMAGTVLKSLKSSTFQNGSPAFLYHALKTLITFDPARVRITLTDELDQKISFEEQIINLFVCNGRFNGGGMKWAPYGNIEDGSFQVVVVRKSSKLKFLLESRKVYAGNIAGMTGVSEYEAKEVLIEPIDPVSIELDGEIPEIESPRSIRFRNMHLQLPIVV